MHGRPRATPGAPVDPAKAAAAAQRLTLLTKLTDAVLAAAAAGDASPAALKLNATLLAHNPDCYTAWNARRAAVGPALVAGGAAGAAAAAGELAVAEAALRRNPKSYPAWHHRRWVVGHGLTAVGEEVALVDKLLDVDNRNFHAWSYRRHVLSLGGGGGGDAAAAVDAAAARVAADFSNYSAWHERATRLAAATANWTCTTLADLMQGGGGKAPPSASPAPPPPSSPFLSAAALRDELDTVRQAVFTDPTDQAPWMYHRWLVAQAVGRYVEARQTKGGSAAAAAAAAAALDDTLTAEADSCTALVAAEPDRGAVRWALLTAARLAEARAWLAADAAAAADGAPLASPPPPPADAVALYRELEGLDPMRAGFYRDAADGRVAAVFFGGGGAAPAS